MPRPFLPYFNDAESGFEFFLFFFICLFQQSMIHHPEARVNMAEEELAQGKINSQMEKC